MASISCQHIYKIYPGATAPSVTDFNLEIQDKEFIIFVGPSGCGKSTTLRMIAGLEEISKGEMYIGGRLINDVPPKDRDIAMVFQSYALYPNMTVYENMAFTLELKKVPKDEIDRKVRSAAEILGITEYLDRKPKALSGGQRQRVAIGRAIVRDPKVFLMDEPLSNLDAKLRVQEVPLDLAEKAIQQADVLIDVREAEEYMAGHIPGAVHMSRGVLEFKLSGTPALAARDTRITLYCKTSGRAALAACALQSMGYLNVQSIAGGFDAWVAAGKSVAQPEQPSFE